MGTDPDPKKYLATWGRMRAYGAWAAGGLVAVFVCVLAWMKLRLPWSEGGWCIAMLGGASATVVVWALRRESREPCPRCGRAFYDWARPRFVSRAAPRKCSWCSLAFGALTDPDTDPED